MAIVARVLREFGALRISTIDWPIILMDMPEGHVADSELRDALRYVEELLRACVAQRERCTQVTDLTRVKQIPTASQRRIAADWITKTLDLQREASLGGANVTPSAILRGIITAIQWVQRPPAPAEHFATRSEAMLQAIRWLDEGRVLLPPGLQELRKKLELELARDKQASRWRLRG